MGRRIISKQLQTQQVKQVTTPTLDGYFDRVVKYIPADIVGAWIVVKSATASASTEQVQRLALWILFGVFLVLSGWWTWWQTRDNNMPPAKLQIAVSTSAFAVWVLAIGPPFDSLPLYEPWIGSVILVVFTLITGRIIPK